MSITTPEKYRRSVQEIPEGDSMTEQSHIPQCDIHTIMRRYEQTGYIDHFANKKAFYDNVADFPDYKSSLDTVREVEQTFETLPSDARALFNNDPAQYMQYLSTVDIQALQSVTTAKELESGTTLQGTPLETATATQKEP